MELFIFKGLYCFSYFPLWNFLRSEQLLIGKGTIKIYNIICIFMKFEGKREKIQNYRNETGKISSKEFLNKLYHFVFL